MTAFLTQNHHLDLGVVLLPRGSATIDGGLLGEGEGEEEGKKGELVPHLRFRGESYVPVPKPLVAEVPRGWLQEGGKGEKGREEGGKLRLEIKAANATHYVFSAGPAGARSRMRRVMEVSNEPVSWGFTGGFSLFFSFSSRRKRRG